MSEDRCELPGEVVRGRAARAAGLVGYDRDGAVTAADLVHDANGKLGTGICPEWRHGLDFLGAPVVADVTGDGKAQVIDAGDASTVHALI